MSSLHALHALRHDWDAQAKTKLDEELESAIPDTSRFKGTKVVFRCGSRMNISDLNMVRAAPPPD